MRVLIRKVLVVFVVILATSSCKDSAKTNADEDKQVAVKSVPDTVWMTGVKFQPETIVVNKGDTIVWVNKDIVAHNITVLPNQEWTSGNIATDGMWKMVVEDSFDYFCSIHPPMKGSVEVK